MSSGNGNTKDIVIGARADETSFKNAGRVVDDLTNKVKNLVNEVANASRGLASLGFGGGAPSGGLPTVTAKGGRQPTGSYIKPGVGLPALVTGAAQSSVASLSASKTAFTNLSKLSKDALETITKATKGSVDSQKRELDNLGETLDRLSARYEKLKRLAAEGFSPARIERVEDTLNRRVTSTAARYSSVADSLSKDESFLGQLSGTGGRPGGGGRIGGFGVGAAQAADMVGNLAGVSGIGAVLRAAGPMGLVVAGLSAYSSASSSYYDTEHSTLRHGFTSPLWSMERQARIGGSIGSMGNAVFGGDLGMQHAIAMARQDPRIAAALDPKMDAARRRVIGIETGQTNGLGDMTVNAKDRLGKSMYSRPGLMGTLGAGALALGAGLATVGAGVFATGATAGGASLLGIPVASKGLAMAALGVGTIGTALLGAQIGSNMSSLENNAPATSSNPMSAREVERMKRIGDLGADKAEIFSQSVNQIIQSDPKTQMILNAAPSHLWGQIAASRALGTRTGTGKRNKDGKIDNPIGEDIERIHRRGYNEGEIASIRNAFAGAAGRGYMKLGDSYKHMEVGGVHNVSALFAAASQLGGKAGGDAFLNQSLNKAIGGSLGVDITAGSRIAEMVAMSYMNQGSMQSAGGALGARGALEGLLAAAYTGSPGGDMRMSGIIGSGIVSAGSLVSGFDPLQKALNYSAMKEASQGLDLKYGVREAIANLDPVTRLGILRKGESAVPAYIKAMVGSDVSVSDLVKKYASNQERNFFSRMIDNRGAAPGTDAYEAYRGVMTKGSISDFLGLSTGKERHKKISDLTGAIVSGISISGMAPNEVEGLVNMLGAGDPELLKALKQGTGAGDTMNRKGLHGDAATQKGDQDKKIMEGVADNAEKISTYLKNTVETADDMWQLSGKLQGTVGKVGESLEALSRYLDNFLRNRDPKEYQKLEASRRQMEAAAASDARTSSCSVPTPTPPTKLYSNTP